MPICWGMLKKSPIKNALLDGTFLAQLVNQPGFFQPTLTGERDSGRARTFGWDNIQENTKWDTAPTNVRGLALNPQAIGVCAGLPAEPPMIPGGTLQESVITVPGPDISIAAYTWFSLQSRQLWQSFDVMFGAGAGDCSAAVLILNTAGTDGSY